MKTPATRALVVGASIAAVLGILHMLGVGLKLLLALALFFAAAWIIVPLLAVRWLGDINRFIRGRFWAREQGVFHSFGGAPLRIEDDGRHVWVDGDGYLRALGRREPEDALAARHTGMWRRDDQGVLMLRVDAVVLVLAHMPGRVDPRVQRLRRYFEREVLYPAGKRRDVHSARAGAAQANASAGAARGQWGDGDQETKGPGPGP